MGRKQTLAKGLKRLKVVRASSYHSFPLQSFQPELATTLIKMDIYQALRSRTQNNTKHVCLQLFSCWVIGCKHLLIQLWINSVAAEGLHWVTFRLETHRSLAAPLLPRSSRGGAAICHTLHAVFTPYQPRGNHKTAEKKDLGLSLAWHKYSPYWTACAHAGVRRAFSSLSAHSFWLRHHAAGWRVRERARESGGHASGVHVSHWGLVNCVAVAETETRRRP